MAQKYRFHEPKDVKYTTNKNTNAQQSIYKNSYVAYQNLAHCTEWQKLCLHHMLSQLYIDEIITSQPMCPIHLTLASFHRPLQLNYTLFAKQLTCKCCLALTTSQPTRHLSWALVPPQAKPCLLLWSVCFVLILQEICLEGPPASHWKGEQRWFWQLPHPQLLQQEWIVESQRKLQKSEGKETRKLNPVLHENVINILFFSGRF